LILGVCTFFCSFSILNLCFGFSVYSSTILLLSLKNLFC
jgi:hypothetical protein